MSKPKMWAAAAAAAVLSLALAVLVAPVASAAPEKVATPDPNLTVTSVTLGRGSVAVSSLNLFPVPVTVKAKWDVSEPGDAVLNVFLERTAGTGPLQSTAAVKLTLAEGNVQTGGTWKGTLYVPSTANGTFKVSGVQAGWPIDGSTGDMTSPTPFAGPSIAITGSNLPKLTVAVIPAAVPVGKPYKVRVTVLNSATGKPYGTRINVQVTVDNLCVESDGDRYLTNTAGVVEVARSAVVADWLNCVRLRGPAFDILGMGFEVPRPATLSAVPSKTSVKVNTIVPVDGSVAKAPSGCAVVLQRLHGATQWRTASQASVRTSGRYTVLAQPPVVGNNVYRVYLPACKALLGYSKNFVIRGT
jgi:hypothetical protein